MVVPVPSLNALIARKTDTQPALVTICAWCPDFDPTAAANKGATHGICTPCLDRVCQEIG
jgi:hypothetical protein